jgi:hypothetical protein
MYLQGVPGAYSEAAAAKAYPSCEAVPCDQFEAAFQVLLTVGLYAPGVLLASYLIEHCLLPP